MIRSLKIFFCPVIVILTPRNVHFLKFSKIYKNYTAGPIFQNATWECLGLTSGAPQGCTPCAGAASKGGAPPCGEGPTWPSTHSSTYHSTLFDGKTHHHCSNPSFLLFLLEIFDLLAQPIFAAEIWSICSPVCDSSDYPNRILFS